MDTPILKLQSLMEAEFETLKSAALAGNYSPEKLKGYREALSDLNIFIKREKLTPSETPEYVTILEQENKDLIEQLAKKERELDDFRLQEQLRFQSLKSYYNNSGIPGQK